METTTASPGHPEQEARVKELEAALVVVTQERDLLRASHERLRLELDLLKRRIYVATAERIDTRQLELEFAQKLALLDALPALDSPPNPKEPKKKTKPTGRRDLSLASLEEERVEIADPLFEDLVAKGEAERIGHEESYKISYKRGGLRRLVMARVKYRAIDGRGQAVIETAEMPKELLPRSLATPSLLARIAIDKHCDGLPLYRIEDRFARDGFTLDRGTMCRWLEEAGATAGATVIEAARKDAMRTAFCIATDATGVSVQPEPLPDKARQACRRAHYFVLIADKDHIFFEYTPKETSAVVSEMFRDFSGYIQADAKSVYDVLFRKPKETGAGEQDTHVIRHEVGCWSHCRRGFWEATVQKNTVAREGLARIGRMFEIDARFRGKPRHEIKRLRDAQLRPHFDAFFAWAKEQLELVREQRCTLRSALGYALRHEQALRRVLDDGRLVLENNRSERALRKIAVGRKAWLFVGSDDHGTAAGHLFSLIASARLHELDPELYLRDLFRVLPHWPADRYLELAPKYWAKTRATLDAAELAAEVGPLHVPELQPEAAQPCAA
jgi:transposase